MNAKTLKNGLRLAAYPVRGTRFIDLVIAIHAGSRHEPEGHDGISHLLEHMMFRGSKKYPSSYALNHALETHADGLEAGTGREVTLYAIQFLPESMRHILSVLSDLFQGPKFSELDTEKEIIYEEILEELGSEGEETGLDNLSRGMIFGPSSPLGKPILGRRKNLRRIDAKKLRAHFRRTYLPSRMVAVAAGAVDPSAFHAEMAKAFAWMKEPRPRPVVVPVPQIAVGPQAFFREKDSSQIETVLTFLGKGERSSTHLAQMALERVLDDGLASRLQRALCEKRGLLYDIGLQLDSYSDLSLLDFSFRVAERKALSALGTILGELESLREKPLPADELSRLKARMLREAIALFESPRALAGRAAETLLLGLDLPLDFKEWKRRIQALDAETLRETARGIFRRERMFLVAEGEIPARDRRAIERVLKQF